MTAVTVLHEAEIELWEAVQFYESRCVGLDPVFPPRLSAGFVAAHGPSFSAFQCTLFVISQPLINGGPRPIALTLTMVLESPEAIMVKHRDHLL